MNPQPLAADVYKRYTGSYGNDYLNYELENEAVFLELQKIALEDAGFYHIEKELFEKGKPKVLDAGCATGAMLAYLDKRGWETAGVEISPAALYAQKERGLNVLCCSLEEADFQNESIDVALVSHLIEHLNNPAAFMRELLRILRPGAYLFLTTPNINGFQAKLFGNNWRSAIFDHLYLFSKTTIKALLNKYGFDIQSVYTWGGLAAGTAPRPIKIIADKTAKKFGFGDVMLIKAKKCIPC